MKKHLFFGLSFIAVIVAFVSCNMKAVMSPSIKPSATLIRTTAAGVRDTISYSDSLNVGDTVRMSAILNGYYDYITSFVAASDEANVDVSIIWQDSTITYLAEDADPEHGILKFVPERVYGCYVPIQYIPKHSGTYRIDLTVTSAAESPYSNQQKFFYIAVR